MSRAIIVVHNQRSGSALSERQLKALFVKAGFSVTTMIAISDSLERDLQAHIKKRSWIAAVGGDGTISAVAGHLAKTDAVLVPIPGGTLNNFTKDLGVEQDIELAIRAANKGSVTAVDIASVNDRYFVNNSSIGIYPQSLKVRERTEDKLGKWPAAVYGIVRALVRFRAYKVTLAGRTIVTPFVFVGNNDYKIDTIDLAGRTKLTGGKLSVYAVRSARRWGLVRLFGSALLGKLNSANELAVHHAAVITIAASSKRRKKISVSRDGEVMTCTLPLRYEMHKGGLRVVAPRSLAK